MTRIALFPLVLVATLALFSQADAQSGSTVKPQCAPLHTLFKDAVAPCTNNGQTIPNADSDLRWRPCICKDGVFPLAQAADACALAGSGQPPRVTAASMDELCKGVATYVKAGDQKPNPALAGALASSTSIAANMPAPTGGSGGTGGGSSGASGIAANSVLMGVASFAAVVLATAAGL
ncbi:hypothetical protein BGZ70_008779 [Mortierella alpina]|uniref:Uncharacterized protein n=1 Tax=Mortierella alpina TaxID=64518 RepID=A0A9P6M0G4_MORAP|nr:hypothetical protein BGZ70_008779 [Mortierella alpina]